MHITNHFQSLPIDLQAEIITYCNLDTLSQVALVSKSFQIALTELLKLKPIIKNQLFISLINRQTVNLARINNLLRKGIKIDDQFINDVDNLYGLSPKVRQLLNNQKRGISEKHTDKKTKTQL